MIQQHPLFGRGTAVIGRHIDNDDILGVLSDGSSANVHLTWRPPGACLFTDEYPAWSAYGTRENFVAAMLNDALEYDAE